MPPADLPTLLWCFFGFRGRIGREPFVLSLIAAILLAAVALGPMIQVENDQMQLSEYALPILLLGHVVQFALAFKRLHDIGRTGLFAIVMIFPLVNIAFVVFLAVFPGEPGPNRFGDRPNVPPP